MFLTSFRMSDFFNERYPRLALVDTLGKVVGL